jgi:hypothetical protein
MRGRSYSSSPHGHRRILIRRSMLWEIAVRRSRVLQNASRPRALESAAPVTMGCADAPIFGGF